MNAICPLGIVPIRRDPDDRSEMVSQLLYGEQCYILEITGNWAGIEAIFDGYRGFVDRKQLHHPESLPVSEFTVRSPLIQLNELFLPMGSELTGDELPAEVAGLLLSDDEIIRRGECRGREAIVETALRLRNSPYLWGGKSLLGIDCSGLTQVVLKACGYNIPRDSGQQAVKGAPVSLDGSRNGDLAFFCKPGKSSVSHVGIIFKEEEEPFIIHASGKVRVDALTGRGILSEDGNLTHELMDIRNVVGGHGGN